MKTLKPDYAQAKPPASPESFRGDVTLQTLNPGGPQELEVLAVWFKNGARNIPHTHPSDQLLVVVEGQCVVATREERTILDPGQSALVRQGEWHWHGAATTQRAMHLSIKQPGAADWRQPLYDFEDWKPKNVA